jgi:diadenylate cyclase
VNSWSLWTSVDWSSLIDIGILALVLYAALVWFRRTRAAFVLTGILIVSAIYVLVLQFSLTLTAALFEKFFGVLLIALVVIFQEELRHIFERVAVWSLNPRALRKPSPGVSSQEAQMWTRTLFDLAQARIGALVVFKGKDFMDRHLEGGTVLGGQVSEPLIRSLFDPHSIGHDGAVIVDGDRVTSFSVHLPLSKESGQVGKGGTRHAAALGLSERTDALCLVVSEERGVVSLARQGRLWEVSDPGELADEIRNFHEEIHPGKGRRFWKDVIQSHIREKVLAVVLAFTVWFVVDFGAHPVSKTLSVAIGVTNPSRSVMVQAIEPDRAELTFRAPRKVFFTGWRKKVTVSVSVHEEEAGSHEHPLTSWNIAIPADMTLETIDPSTVTVVLVPRKE